MPRFSAPLGRRVPALSILALAAWISFIVWMHSWGEALKDSGEQLGLGWPPLFAEYEPRLTWRVLPAVAAGALLVLLGPRLATRLPFPAVLAATAGAAATWAVALAWAGGPGALTAPLRSPLDALAALPQFGPANELLGTFVDRLPDFPIHVQGHPPGVPLLLTALDAGGLARPGVVAGLVIAAGASAAPAVLVAVRAAAGERTARRAAPWLAVAPLWLWVATSFDALYAGVAAWGVALAVASFPDRRRLALAGGVLFGCALMLTYGAAALAAVPGALALRHRRLKPVLWWGVGALAVLGVAWAAGFGWLEGLQATRVQYYEGLAALRPYRYFVVANLAAAAIACGPATLRGLLALRPRLPGAQVVVAGGLLALMAANLSGLSKGEVERIWLLFTPWIVPAGSFFRDRLGERFWLSTAVATALAVQILLVTPW